MMGSFGSGMGSMWLFALLALAGITLLVILVVRLLGGGLNRGRPAGGDVHGDGTPSRSRARQILDERFARGELTIEDYRERLQALGEEE